MRSKVFIRAKFFGMVLLFLAGFVPFIFGTSYAMTLLPGTEYLGKIKLDRSVLRGPDGLAVGPGAALYVVDGRKNQIFKVVGNGSYLEKIPFMQVSAVGAASDGTLYIGSHKNYSVAIYKDGKVAGYLGSGEKEFSSIRDIAVNKNTGDVYIVDNIANAVKKYNASGKRLGVIEGLNLPTGIAIMNGEIYVVDAPVTFDAMNMKSTGARVSVFDMAGKLQRIFAETIVGADGMFRPSGITVDTKGRVYISDALHNAVFAYNKAGKLIGSIYGAAEEISGAVALTLSHDGILYVASSENNEIQMFSLSDLKTPEPQKEGKSKESDASAVSTNKPVNSPIPDPDPKSVSVTKSKIVVTANSGSYNSVKIFGSDGTSVNEFVPFGAYVGGLDNAIADVNGDGTNEIIVGSMDKSAIVGIFSATGQPIEAFQSFNDNSGVLVRAADLDGNGSAEIIVVKNGGSEVRVFGYAGTELVDTGIDFFACPEKGAATLIAAGDIDDNGRPELVTLTTTRSGKVIRIWKVDTKGVIGQWKAALHGESGLPDEKNEITGLTIANIGGDGVQKILLTRNNGVVTIINRDGSRSDMQLTSVGITGITTINSINVVTGLADGTVHILAPDGTELGFSAFTTHTGVRVSSGNLGY